MCLRLDVIEGPRKVGRALHGQHRPNKRKGDGRLTTALEFFPAKAESYPASAKLRRGKRNESGAPRIRLRITVSPIAKREPRPATATRSRPS